MARPLRSEDAGMARISVVVPIFDVEDYLPDCLRSLAAQTLSDLEVVMVDDGSTDASATVAERFAARDHRFRLISQANGGLGHARNTGVAAATGELLTFVDSDDVVPCDAYERLACTLDESGSDFASGNVLRLKGGRLSQAPFLAATFARTRMRTHVKRFRPLLADRIACNKLWRRAFWEHNALRFPERVLHEDIPVTLPAHVMAKSVDLLADPVYVWRIRDGGAGSITQRRLEMRTLVDRLAAVEHVRAYLAEHGSRRLRRWYDERLARDELRLHLDLLADADPAYRAVFVEHAQVLFEDARPSLFAELPAIDRLKWHLVLRGRTDELLEVLRFQQERKTQTPPLRRLGRWYGDYPFRGDRELAIPRPVYRLGQRDSELSLCATVEELSGEDGRLVVRGHVHLAGLPVGSPADQRVELLAVRPGRWQRLRLRAPAVRAPARALDRPDLAAVAAGDLDRRWSGFEAELSLAALAAAGRRGAATWQLFLYVRSHGLRRRYARFDVADVSAAQLRAGRGLVARASRARPAASRSGSATAGSSRAARGWSTATCSSSVAISG
jgi:CDP-glycerol glycerophosphotransferase